MNTRHTPAETSEPRAASLELLARRIHNCVECPLHESRTTAVPGEGPVTARVMVIGEAPGRNEDQAGRPFIGAAGKYLDEVLRGSGFDRTDFFITNTVKCRPPENRVPRVREVETCTSLYLFKQLELINPPLVLLLGGVAVKKLLGLKTVEEGRGRIIQQEGRKFICTYHPAVRFYREDLAAKIAGDLAMLKEELAQLVKVSV